MRDNLEVKSLIHGYPLSICRSDDSSSGLSGEHRTVFSLTGLIRFPVIQGFNISFANKLFRIYFFLLLDF
jgi:hypothetical protein